MGTMLDNSEICMNFFKKMNISTAFNICMEVVQLVLVQRDHVKERISNRLPDFIFFCFPNLHGLIYFLLCFGLLLPNLHCLIHFLPVVGYYWSFFVLFSVRNSILLPERCGEFIESHSEHALLKNVTECHTEN